MKWIYGKQDWKTMERGQENCFLMTNGLGGFSSMTMIGSASRNDHALLMACTHAPNHRYNLLHRMAEQLLLGEQEESRYWISSQEFADGKRECGYQYLSCFQYEDTPVWRFQVQGVEICKEMGMKPGTNAVGIRYEVRNRGKKRCQLILTPFFQFTKKGSEPDESQKFVRKGGKISSNGLDLYFRTNGTVTDITERTECYFYSYDACDGRRETGRAVANHQISCTVEAGECGVLEVVYEMELSRCSAADIIGELKNHRKTLADTAGFSSPAARMLSKSAEQFISKRESTGGDTILAGFPFFEDWGRDTMIALTGLCISTRRYENAKSILRTFAVHERNGLMPNLFPEGGSEPMYNTVDAALLFINCVYLYYQATEDTAFVQEMYPVMERIVDVYQAGTEFGIHMEEDGLIAAGEGLAQVTWMDVRVGEILPTPRHGKPVEINAYWYNALCIMEEISGKICEEINGKIYEKTGSTNREISGKISGERKAEYGKLAETVRDSFQREFWMENKGCLKDVISGTKADTQIRCNQIWAVSMPFSALEREQERRIVDTVFEKLYTPYGLRTLEMEDEEFHSSYGGPVFERDMAYHQGTVWVFPLGGYYLAYLKVHDFCEEAKETVRKQLAVMESAMREGCIGQLPEIYDGANPTSSRGCFAQAWSVGEILRVYAVLENREME